jgi:hypothetical protein
MNIRAFLSGVDVGRVDQGDLQQPEPRKRNLPPRRELVSLAGVAAAVRVPPALDGRL